MRNELVELAKRIHEKRDAPRWSTLAESEWIGAAYALAEKVLTEARDEDDGGPDLAFDDYWRERATR